MNLEHPKLRPGVAATPDERDPLHIYLWDQLRISEPIRITRLELIWLRLMNGKRSVRDIQQEAMKNTGGVLVPLHVINHLVERLDEALYLNSPRFHDYLDSPDRDPSCIGCYDADPQKIPNQLERLFIAEGGPGLPGEPGCRLREGQVRAVLVPHIDYGRGGVTYGWGFKEIVERTNASLFVIIGTSHYSAARFTLTRKNFVSPLGKVRTDQTYIDHLVKEYGPGLFHDKLAHLPEHSIELEVVLLQYLYAGKKPFRIVPIVVGSFFDCVESFTQPDQMEDVARMISALQKVEATWPEPICYIISGDLAHIGPKFDDPEPVAEPFLQQSYQQDHAILQQAEQGNAQGYFDVITQEQDARRICGLPPTYTVMRAAGIQKGKLLHYGRFIHPEGYESVSFASVALD